MKLDDETHAEVERLSELGNAALDDFDNPRLAIRHWNEALALLPDPKSDWEAATWLHASIGEGYFALGEFDEAEQSFRDAYACPGGIENPLIPLRIGQCAFELERPQDAREFLLRAYMLEGDDIFEDEDEKYFSFLRSEVEL
ncbi:MAG: hypothetical protein K5872_17550 [Rhizobiaceae bacterium]|nr:hypothetical protein [Rhizobiaceae bacterium]MCV0408031.1 hypothetical protein [Rhizobiaceae bacterium]